MENNNKKYYSFIALNKCVSDKGASYNAITAELLLTNIKFQEVNGKSLCTARASISNRTKMLNSFFGSNFPENEESVWVDVNFWEERADRIKKFVGDKTRLHLVVAGSATLRKFDKKDGTPGEAITISVNDWYNIKMTQSDKNTGISGTADDGDLPY